MNNTTTAAPATFTIGGDLVIRRLAFGSMRLTGTGNWGEPDDRDRALRVLRDAVDLGVNLIDTSDAYGPQVAEEMIRDALYPYPDDLVIATKGGLLRMGPWKYGLCGHPDYMRQSIELSLRRLKVDRIDVYQVHRFDPAVPMEDTLGALVEAQQEGRIRHIGLSELPLDQLEKAREIADIVSVQSMFNISERRGWTGDSEAVLRYCEEHGIAFLPWGPLGEGGIKNPDPELVEIAESVGATPSQLALAWLLHASPAIVPIPGTSSPEHLAENLGARDIRLSSELVERLDALGRRLQPAQQPGRPD